MNPVEISEIALFLSNLIDVFMPYFQMLFAMMVAFYALFNVRRLLVGAY